LSGHPLLLIHGLGLSRRSWKPVLPFLTREPARLLAANPASRSLMLSGLHGRPWRMPAGDAAAEIREFAHAPGFHSTLYSTTGTKVPSGLSEITVPVRICFGSEDAMLGALTAPRFAAAIRGAQLFPLPGCGHVPMADDPRLVGAANTGFTRAVGG
jgi:pimeloyl-ACP methyl ester carboxylesterase